MKIYVKTSDWSITKIVHETPVMTGNNYVDNIKVFYDTNPSESSFYPTLNILKPNNRKCGPFEFDTASPSYPATEVDDDSNTWYYYVFTLSSDNGQIDVSGKYQISLTTNFYSGNNITGQRNTNFALHVANAVTYDNNNILVLGEEPEEVIANFQVLIQQLSVSNGALSNSKADRNNSNQEIVAKGITVQTFEATSKITAHSIQSPTPGQLIISSNVPNDYDKTNNQGTQIIVVPNSIYMYYGYGTSECTTGIVIGKDGARIHNVQENFISPIATEKYVNDLNVDNTALIGRVTTAEGKIEDLESDLDTEEDTRFNADNDLQRQIDALNAGQNLADIVADLTALGNLDVSNLQIGDKIEVLNDSAYGGVSTVYNWNGGIMEYIGAYGTDAYTKAQTATMLAGKQDLIDSSHKLDADLVDDTNATNKFVSVSEKAQITTNQNAISGIKDGTNIDSFGDVESALANVYTKTEIDSKAVEINKTGATATEDASTITVGATTYAVGGEKRYLHNIIFDINSFTPPANAKDAEYSALLNLTSSRQCGFFLLDSSDATAYTSQADIVDALYNKRAICISGFWQLTPSELFTNGTALYKMQNGYSVLYSALYMADSVIEKA